MSAIEIYNLLKEKNDWITVKEISNKLGISIVTVRQQLRKLLDRDKIQHKLETKYINKVYDIRGFYKSQAYNIHYYKVKNGTRRYTKSARKISK